ncbi:ribonuclease HII [Candidatus Saccharibacteria bacterium]|nr:ribonuclease HII [Candidatus Saccharibacteria bacterium]
MSNLLGIDEVGRGPWAGPLVIGAVVLEKDATGNYPAWTTDLTDSKKLSKKKRESLSEVILKNALATGLGWVSASEIDTLGLAESMKLATRRALLRLKTQRPTFSEIIIDGTVNFLAGTPLESRVTVLKKADLLIKEVSAASIIAKVARDRYMTALARDYPDYGFEKHMGYGTKLHSEMLQKLGPCPEHRRSFRPVAALLPASDLCPAKETPTKISPSATTKQLGDRAETLVAESLVRAGHQILARNHKTRFYEIDIISTEADKIYFTEVKYRKSQSRGTSLEMITKDKLRQMTFAAEAFLKSRPDLSQSYSPLLAAASVSGADFHLDDWFVIS